MMHFSPQGAVTELRQEKAGIWEGAIILAQKGAGVEEMIGEGFARAKIDA